MKILTCPLNGPRNIAEFTYGGQVKPMPNPSEATDQEWAHYVFYGDNHIGVVREWWMHTPSSYWFIVERHNQTDEVIRTMIRRSFLMSALRLRPNQRGPIRDEAPATALRQPHQEGCPGGRAF